MTDKRKNLIFLITYIGYASIYIARINLSIAGPDLKSSGVLTTAQLGFLGTAFSVIYATGRLFTSMWADTAEPKKMIGIGLLFTGLASFGVGFLPPFGGILVLWGINAFAQSMLWSSVLRITNALFQDPAQKTGRLSIIVSTVTAGQLAGILLAMVLLEYLGLRWAFLLPGVLTFALGIIVFTVYPLINAQAGEGSNAFEPVSVEKNPFRKMLGLMKYEDVRMALLPSAFMGLLKDNVTLWMAVYFVDTYGIDLQSTTGYVLFIPVVGLVARLLFPAVLKMCKNNEHRVSMLSFAGSFVMALLLVIVKNPLLAVISLSMLYAFMSLTNSSMLSIFPARFAKDGCIASVSGVMDFVAYLGAGVGSMVFGVTIDSFGYAAMFAAWAVLAVIGYFVMKKICSREG